MRSEHQPNSSPPAHPGIADILTLGFGTAVASWAVGYFCRLFGPAVPPPVLFSLLLACLLTGGFAAGRWTQRGTRGGLYAGLIVGLLNLLVVGSLISGQTPNSIKTGALLWIPGTLLVCAFVMTLGAGLGTLCPAQDRHRDWPGHFAVVAVLATLLLLAAGGLVTGLDEGLAVVDWPTTEGYNMFLYPFARMTGGVYLEHSHRLLGSLVGLTTLVLAFYIQLTESRRALQALAWTALCIVIIQGILGGLRVTGRFTLSTQPGDTQPSIILAIVHGVFGQLVFGTLVALAVCRSRRWSTTGAPTYAPSASTDRTFGVLLIAILIVQLVLGALVRHFSWALDILRYGLSVDPARLKAIGQHVLHVHITFAVLAALLAVAVGVRAWGMYRTVPTLRRLGSSLLVLTGVQLALGIAALVVSGANAVDRRPGPVDVTITTLHQLVGAALLAWAVMLLMWNYRLLTPKPATVRGEQT